MYRTALDSRKLFQERREDVRLVRGDKVILRKLVDLPKDQGLL